jgi:hypothetical protein
MRVFLAILTAFYWAVAGVFLALNLLSVMIPTEIDTIARDRILHEPTLLARLLGWMTILACAVAPLVMKALKRNGQTLLAQTAMTVPVALYATTALVSPAHAKRMANWIYAVVAVIFDWTPGSGP